MSTSNYSNKSFAIKIGNLEIYSYHDLLKEYVVRSFVACGIFLWPVDMNFPSFGEGGYYELFQIVLPSFHAKTIVCCMILSHNLHHM